MQYQLSNIKNKSAVNPGGLCYFLFVPKEWVETSIRISLIDHKVLTEITLIAGKSWLKATCMQDTTGFAEPAEITPAGTKYTQSIQGVINGDDQDMNTLLNGLPFYDYVVIAVDRTGQKKLIGNKTHGMRFVAEYSTGIRYAEKRAYNIALQHESDHKAPVYPF